MACGAARASGALSRRRRSKSARSYKSLREIGDRTAQPVGFQFQECIDQARAMGRKRHLGEDGALISLVFFAPVGSSSKK
jgi:hypothetical protein